MLMAIDVGNTNITIGFYDGDDLVATKRASTAERRTSDEIAVLLYAFMDLAQILPDQIDAVIVSSVVPKIMHSLKNAIVKYLHLEPLIVGPGIRTGISVQLDNPRSVGADRIADCAG
ncbi:type III pantothenate kinase, partial [Faecalibaculum rodentium]